VSKSVVSNRTCEVQEAIRCPTNIKLPYYSGKES